MAGWITIAKNEMRKYTSRFRNNRKLFWIIIAIIVISISIFIPIITHALADPLIRQALSDFGLPISVPLDPSLVKLIMPFILPIFQLGMLMIFLMFIMYPVGQTLQELNIGHLEMVLSAPIRPRDVLFGEFVGQLPIVAVGVSILSSVLISIISLMIQVTVLVAIIFTLLIVTTYLTAIWIGTMLAAWLSMKFGFSEKGQDKAKSFMMVFAILILVPNVTLQTIPFYFPELLTNEIFRAIIQCVPTSWIADTIFILFLSSAGIVYTGVLPIFNTVTIPIFLSLFFGLVFLLGYLRLDKIYNFEAEAQSSTVTVIKENVFYQFTKKYLGHFFTIQLKDFFRRKENISRLIYSVAMAFFMPLIIMLRPAGQTELINVMGLGFWILMIGIMYAIMFGSVFGSTIMMRSKDMVWIYKKSPKGSSVLPTSFFWAITFIALIFSVPLAIIFTLILNLNVLECFVLLLFINIFQMGTLLLTIGIQALNPTFKEKSGKMTINVLASIGITVGLMILGVVFAQIFWEIGLPWDYAFYFVPILGLFLGLPLFYVGVRHLNHIE